MPRPDEQALRALFDEVKQALGVGDHMADALVRSCDPDWQRDMIDKYGGRLSAWERDDLARRIQPDDDDEEAMAK
jgi:hypothetical protein